MADKKPSIKDEIWAILREIAKRQAEGERRQAEGERRQAKTDRLLRRLGRQIGGQSDRWGKIVESLVEGDSRAMLTKFLGIEIIDISRRVEVKDVEIDLIAVNTDTVVVIEVKTTLQREDIDTFISTKLNRFIELRPYHKGSKIYGAIAFVKASSNEKALVDYALSTGLIVIKAMRGTNHLINPAGHMLHNFHPDCS